MIVDARHAAVTIHPDARIESTAVLIGPCVIEAGAYIGHYAVIGSPAQHHDHYPDGPHHDPKGVRVGRGGIVREHCQIQQGVVRTTCVHEGAYVMAGTHVSHDTSIGAYATIGTNSIFGGHTTVLDRVTFGQSVVTHPWVIIGARAMVGQGSCVIRDVAPEQKVAGNPTRLLGANTGAGGGKREWSLDDVLKTDRDSWQRALNERTELRNK